MKPIISLDNVSLYFESPGRRVKVLEHLSLSVGVGESISIVGPSGAGKTSLLMLMAGLEAPTHGKVWVAGENLTHLSEDDLAGFRRENLSIVFQAFRLMPTLTALENVSLPLELAGEKDVEKRAMDSLNAVGLSRRAHHLPAELSGGEQQRVALARAFVTRPKILLADEPTGNLDRATGNAVMDYLFELCKTHNTTFVLVTHDPELAARCQTTCTLRDGQIHKHPPSSRRKSKARA